VSEDLRAQPAGWCFPSLHSIASYDSGTYNVYASLSDVIYRFHTTEENGNIKHKVYVWNRGDAPKLITEEQINTCLEKLANKLHNEIKIKP